MAPSLMHSVLVVDDDISLRPALAAWTNRFGYTSVEAECAEAALERLHESPTDIAICDLNMPGHNGVWLAGQIRQRFPTTAVIMATSVDDVDVAVATLQNDVVDYLLKPFDRERLGEALALGLEWHRATASGDSLQDALRDRLRSRRTAVASTLAGAQRSARDAVDGLIAMLQMHEKDGRGHATRVARLAMALAEELGVDELDIAELELAAMLHDVGKLDVPAHILSKAAPLTDGEWEVMRMHPRVGYDLVKKLPMLARTADYVLAHHEAYDGSGYPQGLKGDEIPLCARILTVADAYDSMTHPHTQRPALPPGMAVSEIERCTGSQFDPATVAALGRVLAGAAREARAS